MNLSSDELERYDRHLKLPGFGLDRQKKLKEAKVLIIGAGGLGCPSAIYLAASGIGNITIIDDDKIELSNLQRQIAFSMQDIGQFKAIVLANKLRQINPLISINAIAERINLDNAKNLLTNYNLVIDGTDNFASRFLIADTCYANKVSYLHASVYQYQGQLSLFVPEEKPCFRCLYGQAPQAGLAACAEAGILGVITGAVGTIAAVEAVKYLTGLGESVEGKVLTYNALSQQVKTFVIEADLNCLLCGKNANKKKLQESYKGTCAVGDEQSVAMERIELKEQIISKAQAADLLKGSANEDIFLVDVREEKEFKEGHIKGALLWPLSILRAMPLESIEHELQLRLQKNKTNKEKQKIICYCQKGTRSLKAVTMLRAAGIENIFSLAGGFEEWQA